MITPQGPYERLAWEDRFNRPSLESLREGFPGRVARLFDKTHRRLLELAGDRFGFAWHGDCWRWTIEYRGPRACPILAIIVPNPEDLQIAASLEPGFIESISTRRLRRSVRDGIALAAQPFDTSWGVWSVSSVEVLDEIVRLIGMKQRYLQPVGG